MSHQRTYRTNTNPHAPLSDADLEKMVGAIFRLMRETGVKFEQNPRVMDLLSDAGCDVSPKGIVKFPTDLVRSCIDSVGKSVKIWNRSGTDFLEISLPHTVFTTNLSAPNFVDIDTGERRPTTAEDLAMICRVADALPHIDGVEVWFRISEADRYLPILDNLTKPQFAAFEDFLALQAAVEVATAVRGGPAQLEEKPFFYITVSGMPLYYCKNDLDQILFLVDKNIPMAVGTMGIGGASAPITIAGNVVNCFASDFAGLVLSQLLRKGSFCMVGSTIAFMDPKTGNLGAMNEFTLAEMVKCQIGRHLGLPQHFANAGITSGKDFNQHTVFDATLTMLAGVFSQAASCSYLGGIDGLQAFSIHSLLLCHELIGTARRMWQGVKVDDETLALDLTHKLGPLGDYLAEMHTAVHCRSELSPIKYFAATTFEAWEQAGRKELKDIIDEDLRKILKAHEPEPLPAPLRKQCGAILEKYRQAK